MRLPVQFLNGPVIGCPILPKGGHSNTVGIQILMVNFRQNRASDNRTIPKPDKNVRYSNGLLA
jgi:hypothetical protein